MTVCIDGVPQSCHSLSTVSPWWPCGLQSTPECRRDSKHSASVTTAWKHACGPASKDMVWGSRKHLGGTPTLAWPCALWLQKQRLFCVITT